MIKSKVVLISLFLSAPCSAAVRVEHHAIAATNSPALVLSAVAFGFQPSADDFEKDIQAQNPLIAKDVVVRRVARIDVHDEASDRAHLVEEARKRAGQLGANALFLDPAVKPGPGSLAFIATRITYKEWLVPPVEVVSGLRALHYDADDFEKEVRLWNKTILGEPSVPSAEVVALPDAAPEVKSEVHDSFGTFFANLKRWTPVRVFLRNGKESMGMYTGTSPGTRIPTIQLRDPSARAFKQQMIPISEIQKVQVLDHLPKK